MKIEIEISKEEIKKAIMDKIAEKIIKEHTFGFGFRLSDLVKETLDKNKEVKEFIKKKAIEYISDKEWFATVVESVVENIFREHYQEGW